MPFWTPNDDLPEKYKSLAAWVRTQRRHVKVFLEDASKLGKRVAFTEEHYQKLMKVGLNNDAKKSLTEKDEGRLETWNERYERLKDYKEEFGDCEYYHFMYIIHYCMPFFGVLDSPS